MLVVIVLLKFLSQQNHGLGFKQKRNDVEEVKKETVRKGENEIRDGAKQQKQREKSNNMEIIKWPGISIVLLPPLYTVHINSSINSISIHLLQIFF